jgi:hypothetical protein
MGTCNTSCIYWTSLFLTVDLFVGVQVIVEVGKAVGAEGLVAGQVVDIKSEGQGDKVRGNNLRGDTPAHTRGNVKMRPVHLLLVSMLCGAPGDLLCRVRILQEDILCQRVAVRVGLT